MMQQQIACQGMGGGCSHSSLWFHTVHRAAGVKCRENQCGTQAEMTPPHGRPVEGVGAPSA